jgi:hypothetical protein
MKQEVFMDKKQRGTNERDEAQQIYRKALVIAFAGLAVQELLFAFFLWIMAVDFATRRLELALAVVFAVVMGAFVFAFTFGSMVRLFTFETATKRHLARKYGAPTTKPPTCE